MESYNIQTPNLFNLASLHLTPHPTLAHAAACLIFAHLGSVVCACARSVYQRDPGTSGKTSGRTLEVSMMMEVTMVMLLCGFALYNGAHFQRLVFSCHEIGRDNQIRSVVMELTCLATCQLNQCLMTRHEDRRRATARLKGVVGERRTEGWEPCRGVLEGESEDQPSRSRSPPRRRQVGGDR